jgi:ribosomal-protein-alanine N-acetyltransferase
MTELRTKQLILRPMSPAAAERLPAERDGAAARIGAALDDDWPLPDLLDILPIHARRTVSEVAFSVWVVIEAATVVVVGDIGFFGPPSETGELETGYSVVPSRRRRGYATEALEALAAWAFEQPGVAVIVAGTDPDNEMSQRVLERAGFQRTTATSSEVRWRRERGASHG